jgi:hypothetical protein
MIDNLWIALCVSFVGSTFFAARLWLAEKKYNKKLFDNFLTLYGKQHGEIVGRIKILEQIAKSRHVK